MSDTADFQQAQKKRVPSEEMVSRVAARAAVDTVADRIGLLQAQVAQISGCLQRRGLDHGVRVQITLASEGMRSVREDVDRLVAGLPTDVAAHSRITDCRRSISAIEKSLRSLM